MSKLCVRTHNRGCSFTGGYVYYHVIVKYGASQSPQDLNSRIHVSGVYRVYIVFCAAVVPFLFIPFTII